MRELALQRDLCNVKDLVMKIIHDQREILVNAVFRDTVKLKLRNTPFVTVDGT